jgi:hypothetical protein
MNLTNILRLENHFLSRFIRHNQIFVFIPI